MRSEFGRTASSTDSARIARFGPDGELLAEFDLDTARPETLAFHPGGLPGYPDPFIYWVDRSTDRLIVLNQDLSGSQETVKLDSAPSGTLLSPVDAVIDAQGVLYVTDSRAIYAFDFLERISSNNVAFLDRVGAPDLSNPPYRGAWDMDIDSGGNVYVSSNERSHLQVQRLGHGSQRAVAGLHAGRVHRLAGALRQR